MVGSWGLDGVATVRRTDLPMTDGFENSRPLRPPARRDRQYLPVKRLGGVRRLDTEHHRRQLSTAPERVQRLGLLPRGSTSTRMSARCSDSARLSASRPRRYSAAAAPDRRRARCRSPSATIAPTETRPQRVARPECPGCSSSPNSGPRSGVEQTSRCGLGGRPVAHLPRAIDGLLDASHQSGEAARERQTATEQVSTRRRCRPACARRNSVESNEVLAAAPSASRPQRIDYRLHVRPLEGLGDDQLQPQGQGRCCAASEASARHRAPARIRRGRWMRSRNGQNRASAGWSDELVAPDRSSCTKSASMPLFQCERGQARSASGRLRTNIQWPCARRAQLGGEHIAGSLGFSRPRCALRCRISSRMRSSVKRSSATC